MEGSRTAAQFQFRPGTLDQSIFDAVVRHNEYRLPRRFHAGDVIVDIGGHIGSFSHAVLTRGAGQVYTFEAEPANFERVCRHLAPFGTRAVARQAAVFRSDQDMPHLSYAYSVDQRNTGGGGICSWQTEQQVPVVKFDDAIDEITQQGRRRVRLLKLDCEGSEWPILLTTRRLHLVDAICGEYHVDNFCGPLRVEAYPHYSPELLRDFLTGQGFVVELEPTQLPCGLFFARRPGVAKFGSARRSGLLGYAAGRSYRLLLKLRRFLAGTKKIEV